MNPTSPDPLYPEPTEQDARDESLGAQLDQYFEALKQGNRASTPTDAELEGLQPIVARLFKLSQGLAIPSTVDYAALPTGSTLDLPRSRGDTSQERNPAPPGLASGTPATIGKFKVLQPLGQGGQASTLLASDPDLRRHVVLKIYHAAHTPQEQDAVLHEGQALARVRSPYVAQCYSAERAGGVPFLVVEYIPGRNLADEHRAHPLTVAQALDAIGRLAEGLAAVHACGLLHRDIKPGNVLMGEDGRPRLVDFGLATPLASADLGHLSGTLAYMAPEQARRQAERIDARTDLYGLGAVLYDLLTERPPHMGATRGALLEAACLGDVTPPNQLNAKVPRPVNDLCMRCLARDPAERFASATELGAAIQRLRRPRPLRSLPYWPLAASAAVAVLLVAFVVWPLLQPDRGDPGSSVAHVGDGPPERTEPKVKKVPTPGHADKSSVRDDATKPAKEKSTLPPSAHLFSPPYLKGRKPRHQFPLTVKTAGSQIDLKTGTHVLTVGQEISFQVEVGRDAYVGVWDVTTKRVYQLFPNDEDGDNLVRANKVRRVPGSLKHRIKATAAAALEFVHVVASTRPLRDDDTPKLRAGGVFPVFVGAEAYERGIGKLRELEWVDERELPAGQTLAVSEVIVPLRILEKEP